MAISKWILLFSVLILLSIHSAFAVSDVRHSVDGNKVTLFYKGTPPIFD